jgi:four helix bundle protein
MFGFQRLDAYQCAVQFLALSVRLEKCLPAGYGNLCDQLRRAALSVPLNVAEGSGKSERDSRRFYSIARGSALECAAILDCCGTLGLFPEADLNEALALLERVVSMLTRMSRG